MIAWFGTSWGAPVCEHDCHVPTPAGQLCLHCEEPVVAGERGVVMAAFADDRLSARAIHLECHLRMIIGGLNHLRGQCTCCGGTQPPDPPGMTRREAAQAAVTFWRTNPDARNA